MVFHSMVRLYDFDKVARRKRSLRSETDGTHTDGSGSSYAANKCAAVLLTVHDLCTSMVDFTTTQVPEAGTRS